MSRILPQDPPYSDKTQKLFDLAMPPGMEPLSLFRVMARSERLLPRFMRAGVLDRGSSALQTFFAQSTRQTAHSRAHTRLLREARLRLMH